MQKRVKDDILRVLEQARSLSRVREVEPLSQLSNHVIHNCSIFQDEASVSTAVIVYALSKILARCGKVHHSLLALLDKCYFSLKNSKERQFSLYVKQLMRAIAQRDKELGMYIRKVLDDAKIRKGCKIYDHGISSKQVCEVVDITEWELMKYIGSTRIPDTMAEPGNIKKRILLARRLFA